MSSEKNGRGDELSFSVNAVNESVSAMESTHQSVDQESGFENTAGTCQSNQEVEYPGCSQQPGQDTCLEITHVFPSDNVQQESGFDSLRLEFSLTSQESECHTDLEVRNDSSHPDGPELCNSATVKEVEIDGCDVDIPPNQVLKDVEEVPCAILSRVTKDGFQVSELGKDVDFVCTVGFLEGREKFSEKCNESIENNVKSCHCNNNTPVVCDRGDQICLGSVSYTSIAASDKFVALNEPKDCGVIQVERDKPVGTPYSSSDLSIVAEELSCNMELFKTLAACVVDEILDEALKSVLQLKNFNVKEFSLKHENIVSQVSDNGERVVTKSPSEVSAWLSENSAMALNSFDLRITSDLNTSNDNIPNTAESMVSENEKIVESASNNISELHNNLELPTQNQVPEIFNGNILPNYSRDFKSTLSSFHATVNTDCEKKFKNFVVEDLEAKPSSNDLITSKYVSKGIEYSSDIIRTTYIVEETEDLQAGMDPLSSDRCLNNVNFVINLVKSKADYSKDVSFDESSPEANRFCLEDSSSSAKDKEEIATTCAIIPDSSITNSEIKNEDPILRYQDQSLEIEKFLEEAGAPLKLDENVDEPDFLCANTTVDSIVVDAAGNLTPNCISLNDEAVCLVPIATKEIDIEDITEKEAGGGKTSFQEIAKSKTESFHIPEGFVPGEVDSVKCDEASVLTSGNEETAAYEPVVDDMAVHPALATPVVGKSERTTEKAETIVGEATVKTYGLITISAGYACSAEKPNEENLNAETMPAITEENDISYEKPMTTLQETTDVTAITGESESISKKLDEVVEKETEKAAMISEGNECTPEKPETSFEEVIAETNTVISDTFQVGTEVSDEHTSVEGPNEDSSKDDRCSSLENAEENSSNVLPEIAEVPQIKQEEIPSKTDGQDVESTFSTIPCQPMVPIVSVCPPITEETYDGLTDDESEKSHATSDSEGDSNVKMVKPVCDGINTINYRPLLEEDSNDRSTLSLISELDEASVTEDNADTEQWQNESCSLISDDAVDRVDNTVSNRELVQRVKGQRIRHGKLAVKLEEKSRSQGESVEEGVPSVESRYTAKIKDIKKALKCSDSLQRLRELAQSPGGLITDEIRKEAWPCLLGIDSSTLNRPLPAINTEELLAHKEYNQVVLDVNRSLRRFPSKISAVERTDLQNQLTEIILRVLIKRRDLSYYQGYHDVAVTTLLVAGKDIAFHILERISVSHLADCMLPTMERTVHLLNYIYPLLQRINSHVVERMDRLEIGTIFCLPWYLTWYGYTLNRYEDIVRVFDYFLASPPLAPLYLAAVVVGRRSEEVLAADSDHATVYSLLSRIPETLPLEDLLQEASDLYGQYPPEKISKEVEERCERLRKAQEEEEKQRRLIQQRKMRVERRHSMPTIAARQMPGWYYFDRFLGFPVIQRDRLIQVSASVVLSFIVWHWRNEVYRYF